jgi:hypothetical protein
MGSNVIVKRNASAGSFVAMRDRHTDAEYLRRDWYMVGRDIKRAYTVVKSSTTKK